MVEGQKIEFSEFVEEFLHLLSTHAGFLIAVMAAIAAAFSIWELLVSQGTEFGVQLVVSIYGQFVVIERMLADRLPEGRGHRRFMSIFGSGFFGGLGIGFGLLLFIFPGIFLAGRWAAAVPAIVAENCGATESLRSSWDRTEASKLQVFLLYLVGMVIWAGSMTLVLIFSATDAGLETTMGVIALNVVVSLVTVLGWVLATAVYRRTAPTISGLDAVFA